MMKKNEIGRFGEDEVCRLLEREGYKIAARNFRIKGGEIDIIAADSDYIVFVEVKTRRPGGLSDGFDAITERKKGLIIRAASEYCLRNPNMLQPRFDVARVIFDGTAVRSIDYIKNAYDTTGYKFIF
ncbi:MAG: YraN family protein [Ruminococcus sp.]|nr:YraN family protein [Oscillospiraceae bacterium]